MTCHVHYFGLLSDRRGLAEEPWVGNASTAGELYEMLNALHRLGIDHGDLRVAVNDEFVTWDHLLCDGDHVALLPPMSGG